jgi:hypothetical protein
MSAGAREAVARKLFDVYAWELGNADAEWDNESPMSQDDWRRDADRILAALAPIIAAEIRAYADRPGETDPGVAVACRQFMKDADAIASRICGGGE